MQRLVEQPADVGDVFEGSLRVGRVHYHLAVYQHFSQGEGEPVPTHVDVEGRVVPLEDADLNTLHAHGPELTLHLADGRLLDFTIASATGTIRSTGRGLYDRD